jgi:hypothetical protein
MIRLWTACKCWFQYSCRALCVAFVCLECDDMCTAGCLADVKPHQALQKQLRCNVTQLTSLGEEFCAACVYCILSLSAMFASLYARAVIRAPHRLSQLSLPLLMPPFQASMMCSHCDLCRHHSPAVAAAADAVVVTAAAAATATAATAVAAGAAVP